MSNVLPLGRMQRVLAQLASNEAARRNFAKTITEPVPMSVLEAHLRKTDVDALRNIYGTRSVPTWGLKRGRDDTNLATWSQLESGDVAVFLGSGEAFASGVVIYKVLSGSLASDLWGVGEDDQTWECVYFLDVIVSHRVPYAEINNAAGYQPTFTPRGTMLLSPSRSAGVLALLRPDLHGAEIRTRLQSLIRGNRREPSKDDVDELPEPEYTAQAVITRDYWTTGDRLGYEPYAQAIAEFLQHPDTRPPLTIGITAPWGAGKTSLMRIVQDLLEPPQPVHPLDTTLPVRRQIHLTPTSRAQVADRPSRWWQRGQGNRGDVSELPLVTNGTILRKLKEQTSVTAERVARIAAPGPGVELQAEPPEQSGLIGGPENWRPTVWFNPWMYQSGEQVWAGLAYEVISQITGRMPAAERERFWLKLNLRRVDGDAVRRRVHRALIERLIPLIGWLLILILSGLAVAVLHTHLSHGLELVARGLVAASSGGLVVAGLVRMLAFRTERASGALTTLLHEPAYAENWRRLLNEQTKNAQDEFVRNPGYEARLGFLYLVHTDMKRVLDLVATPQRPVVVLVDDLDRCSPGTVAQVIEAVNLFLAGQFPNCVFVLAMEPEMVAAHVQVAYRELASTDVVYGA